MYNWLVVWNTCFFSIYRECHYPNWRTHIFQRGRLNHQPDIIWSNLTRYNPHFQMFLTEFWQKMNMSCCPLRHQLRWNPPFLVDLPQFCSGPMAIFAGSISSAVIIFPGKTRSFHEFSWVFPHLCYFSPKKNSNFRSLKIPSFARRKCWWFRATGWLWPERRNLDWFYPRIQEIEKWNHLIYPLVT